MKYYLIILLLILIFCTGLSTADPSYQPNVDRLEYIFKKYIPLKNGIAYTKVPRGLIVSIDENLLFSKGDARIKESSLCILDRMILLLHKFPNYCVVEDHTANHNLKNGSYAENWELSLARSSNIVEYMIECGCLHPSRFFSLGYGEYMPLQDNIAENKFDNRVDFVIIEYDVKR